MKHAMEGLAFLGFVILLSLVPILLCYVLSKRLGISARGANNMRLWRVVWFSAAPGFSLDAPPALQVEVPDQLKWESYDLAQLYAALHRPPGISGFKIIAVVDGSSERLDDHFPRTYRE